VPATEEGNYGSLECSAGPIAPDLTAPTVAIAYPADGDVLPPGSTFDILVDAQDERGVADVLLYVNGQPQYKVFAEPWEWPVQNIPEGTYELGAVASDGPNWTASQPIYFTVGEGAGETGETGGDGDETGTDEGGTGSGGSEDAGAEPSAEGGGCGCRTLGGGTTGALGWLVVAAGSLRRRRPREGA
jgi:hypothetical protein